MFIDKNIILDNSKLPQMLQDDFSALQSYYDSGDWFNFGIMLENSVPSIKAFYANGSIDGTLFDLIRKKFGIV
ncbi:MAG: hypothetical protein K6B43_11980 [Treponema sp.]|nr:hypothetical protein [Treponema sp.]